MRSSSWEFRRGQKRKADPAKKESVMPPKVLKRNLFQRLLGIPLTRGPRNADCWRQAEGKVIIDLRKAPELTEPGSGFCLESSDLPERFLVIHGTDGKFYAFKNRCTHGGRRLDPMPDQPSVQCCSVGKSTFDYEGNLQSGSANEGIVTYPTSLEGSILTITITQ